MQKAIKGLVLALLLALVLSGVTAAKAKGDDGVLSTKMLSSSMVEGYCPTEIDGRQVLFIEDMRLVAPQVLAVDISRLGSFAAATAEGPFGHKLELEAYIAGTGERVGYKTESSLLFEGGSVYNTFIPLSRELTQAEMDKLYVVSYVDGAQECQRTWMNDEVYPVVLPKEHFTITVDKVIKKEQDVIITLDKKDLGKDYFVPYTMFIVLKRADGTIVSQPYYFTAWFKEGKYVCPDAVLESEYLNLDPHEILYAYVGYLRNPAMLYP